MMASCEVITEFARTIEQDGFANSQPDPTKYVKLQENEVGDFLRYIQTQQEEYAEWIVLTQAEGVQPANSDELSTQDIEEVNRLQTLHTSGNLERQLREIQQKIPPTITTPAGEVSSPPSEQTASEEDENWQREWLLLEREAPGTHSPQQLHLQSRPLPPQCSFFHNWPSFKVADKLLVVAGTSGAAFTLGFTFGIQATLNSICRMLEHPIVAGGAAMATALGAYFTPQVLLTAVGYVAIGGVVGGVGMAAPVLVVGSAGVFVAAGAYHGYVATKRLIVGHDDKEVDSCSEASCPPSNHQSTFALPSAPEIQIPHPSTAAHIARELAQKFVKSHPPPMGGLH